MSGLVCVSQKIRKLFEPEKQFVKLRPARSIKLVFPFVVKSIKIKITAKFRDMEHLRFEDTKRIMSHEKFRDFRETGPWKQNRFFIFKNRNPNIRCGISSLLNFYAEEFQKDCKLRSENYGKRR